MYGMMIKGATWLAGAGLFAYVLLLLAARSDGPGGVEIDEAFQRLFLAGLTFLGVVAAAAQINEVARQRQQAALLQHLTRHREAVKEELGIYLRDEITVWITRSEAHGRARLIDELTETLDARLRAAMHAVSKQAGQEGDKNGFARGVSARASVPGTVPHVLGNNVFQLPHLQPRDTEE